MGVGTLEYMAYQEAVWAGADAGSLMAMRADIIAELMTSYSLSQTQATARFWRTLAEVRDNDM